MNAAADRLEFAPPPQPGLLRAFVLAVVAHLLLLAALTWGVRWKNDTRELSAEAELWSSVPVQAAPKLVEAPPAPPPPPKVQPAPAPPPLPREADIALEREKQKQAEAKKKQDELERQKRLQAEKLEAQKKLELARKAAEDQKKQDAALKARDCTQGCGWGCWRFTATVRPVAGLPCAAQTAGRSLSASQWR
jgi:colicin import membrane protein